MTTKREELFNKLFNKTPPCSEKEADAQLIPEKIEITRFNGLTDRKVREIYGNMIVDYKYINELGKTMQVINSRVLKDTPCIEYQLPTGHTPNFLSGVAEKQNNWVEDDGKDKFCNNEFESYKNNKLLVPVNVPFDIDITGSSIGKRIYNSFKSDKGVPGGSRPTRKCKKKRSHVTKKRRGTRTRIATRKRK